MRKLLWIISLVLLLLFCFCGCKSDKNLSFVVITDTHFSGKESYSYEGSYLVANDTNGSGKQMRYIDEIFDAFIEQMKTEKPDYILVTGDLTFVGAKESHLAFAEKLSALEESGAEVLVIPGNHDIVSYAFTCPDGEPVDAASVTAEEFPDIYSDFGYSGAASYDENSLSYVYDTGKGCRIFMLDTNFMYGAVFGQLSQESVQWLEEQLKACEAAGDVPLAAGHHNLLVHNKFFTLGYTINNYDQIKELFEKYNVELYLSGHIHTQHIASEENVTDIVTESFAVFPHRYGLISLEGENWSYEAKPTDVSGYSEKAGITDENLLNYDEYGFNFFYNNAYNQAKEKLTSLAVDSETLEAFADMSAATNVHYFGGTLSKVDDSLLDEFYELTAGTRWGEYMKDILDDKSDQLKWQN